MDKSTPTNRTTTSKKRKHSEYYDPDYSNTNEKPQNAKRINIEMEEEKEDDNDGNLASRNSQNVAQLKRIEEIVRAEFQKELSLKEQQLIDIDNRIAQARQLLDKLRFQVVSEYYKKQQVNLTAPDVSRVRSGDSLFADGVERSGPQLPLHPAIKKIVGKQPLPIQLHLPERNAATLAKQNIQLRNPAHRRAERRRQQKIREQGIVTDHTLNEKKKKETIKMDEQPSTSREANKSLCELDGSMSQLNVSRSNNKSKFHFVVGNTSKYIGGVHFNAGGQSLAYKWLVYVQGKGLPQPPEAYLKKVRFQMHHSYRPNDIVDVHEPPFQLTRRGWGEFPIRLQLYFQEHLQQKPVQLMHNIVLDKTMCGLHTMGGETTVEVWLRANSESNANAKTNLRHTQMTPSLPLESPKLISCKPRTISITANKEELDDNLFGCISKIELSDDIEQIEPTVLVSEPLKLSSPKKSNPIESSSLQLLSQTGSPIDQWSVIGSVSSSKAPHAIPSYMRHGHTKAIVKNVVFQKAGKLYIIDPLQSKLKQAAKQQSLLKPQRSLLKQPAQQLSKRWQILECIYHDHGYANMCGHELVSALDTAHNSRTKIERFFNDIPFQSMCSALEFLLRRLPLTGTNDNGFPFIVNTEEAFHAQSALRQRFYEYMRGRVLSRWMRQHLHLQQLHASGQETYWSIREIVAFARLNGYTPSLKLLSVNRQQRLLALAPLAKRVQQQLKEEPQPQLMEFCSLSSTSCIEKWLREQSLRMKSQDRLLENQQLVDVIGLDLGLKAGEPQARLTLKESKNAKFQQLFYLPPPKKLETAMELVRDMCKDLGIALGTEQSVPGVSQSLALTLLAHVLRMFMEKLVRRAVATKLHQEQAGASNVIIPLAVANFDLSLLPYDIAHIIVQSPEFDFLGNRNLAVTMSNSQA
ncbi:D12 [Drosophila busckii]|uniref:D12 n=1 Tax=Drosophila busckii TaxID=30019 RepID=A0A0M5J617_DROBS|nr:uncharacterized protein LOC108598158 [Drosophila busckii]ALC38974.1 D12 [Drosophila busckii]